MEGSKPSIDDIILKEVGGAGLVYLRELQFRLEKPPLIEHWDIATRSLKLAEEGKLRTRRYREYRWYFPNEREWEEVKELADKKVELADYYIHYPYSYVTQPQGTRYDDYSEYLRPTRYFQGRTYAKMDKARGPQPNLDFIARHPDRELYFGMSLKNKLSYPKDDEITVLLDICEQLQLTPVMVTRLMSGKGITRIDAAGGYSVVYKLWLRPPEMPREKYDLMSNQNPSKSLLMMPLGVYRFVPKMLVRKAEELKLRFSGGKEGEIGP
ncbi:MAG: hypothetical protein ABSG45_09025 [Nitrososphaerales archaeon]